MLLLVSGGILHIYCETLESPTNANAHIIDIRRHTLTTQYQFNINYAQNLIIDGLSVYCCQYYQLVTTYLTREP